MFYFLKISPKLSKYVVQHFEFFKRCKQNNWAQVAQKIYLPYPTYYIYALD